MTTRTFIRILLFGYFASLLSISSYGQCTSVTTLGGLTSGSKFKISVKQTGNPIRVRTDSKLEESTTDNNNVFQLVDVGSGYFKIVNDANSYVLEIDAGSTSPGAFLMQTSSYTGSDQQKFKFELIGSSFKIIPKHTESFTYGLTMETYTGSGEYGLIRQYGYSNSSSPNDAELFNICKIGCTPPSAPTSVAASPANIFVSGTSSLSATCSSGTVRWYDVSTGGTTVGTGTPWTTPTLTTTKTYYAACFNTCESTRTSVTVTVCPTTAPTSVAASPANRTSAGTSSLSAACSSGTVRWYDVASGGTTVGTGSPWTTPSLSATKTYYAACFNTCESARVSVTVCISPAAPTSVTAAPSNISVSGTSSLSATCSSGTVRWYDVSTGGTTVGTGSPWTTPTLTSTKTYYAACFNTCESARTSVTVTVCATTAPTSVTATPAIRSTSGTSSLSATCSSGTVRWYDVAAGGTTVGTGSPWVTPSLSATKTYYAACFNSCEGTRVAVTVCITPAAPSGIVASPSIITSGSTVSLTATCSSGTIRWYDVATGGATVGTGSPWTTPTLTATKTYYAACFNTCESATRTSATISVCPTAPTSVSASPSTVSSGGTSSLSATCSSGTVLWYDVAAGGGTVGTGSPWTTPTLTATKTYYAACNSSCESARGSVTVTVTTTLTCTAVTSSGGLTSGSKFKFKVKLTGNAIRVRTDNKLEESTTDSNNEFQLVDVGSGYFKIVNDANGYVLEVQSGSQSQGAFLVQTATYSGTDQQKFKFTLVGSSFKMIPKHTESFTYGIAMETYTGSGEYGLIRQYGYNSPVEDFQLFDICILGAGCAPSPTGVSATTVYNTSGTSTLTATCSSGSVRWYGAATGGTALGTTSPWTTPTITTTKTYYAACTGTCESTRVSVTAIVTGCSAPAAPTSVSASASNITSGNTVSLSASCSSGTVRWYNDASGGTTAGTGSPWTTPTLTATKTYYAACYTTCENSRVPIEITVGPGPVFTTTTDTYFLSNGIIKIGFSRKMGGAISHLMKITGGVDGDNMIDNLDAGRQAGLDPYISVFQNGVMIDGSSTSRINWLNNSLHSNQVWSIANSAPSTNGYFWNGLPQGNFYNKYIELSDTYANPSNLGGDPASNGGTVSFNSTTGELYIKSKLYLWNFVTNTPEPYSKIEAGAWNEYWFKLDNNAVKVKITQTRDINLSTISNITFDTESVGMHIFAGLAPASNGTVRYSNMATYDGTSPWTNGSILKQNIDTYKSNHGGSSNWDIAYQAGTQDINCCKRKNWENWAAVVDNNDFGLGIYTEDTRFTDFYFDIDHGSNHGSGLSLNGKFFCANGNCKQGSDTFEYAYVVGTVSEIRSYAYSRQFTPNCNCGARTAASTVQLLEDSFKEEDKIRLYPNPTNSQTELEIETDKDSFADVFVANSQGRILQVLKRQLKAGSNVIQIDLNDPQEGVYVLKVVYDGKAVSRNLVITK